MALEMFVSSAEHAGWGDRALWWPQAVVITKCSRSRHKGPCGGTVCAGDGSQRWFSLVSSRL